MSDPDRVEIESLAATLWRSVAPWPDEGEDYSWAAQDEFTQNVYRVMAQAAVDAITAKLTRVDVVLPGRFYPNSDVPVRGEYWADSWELSLQDGGRTLKLFGKGSGSEAKALRDQALVDWIAEGGQ